MTARSSNTANMKNKRHTSLGDGQFAYLQGTRGKNAAFQMRSSRAQIAMR
jgi:hypothetical protein